MNIEWDKFNETVAFLSDMTNDAEARRLSIDFFTNHLKKFQIEQKELKKKLQTRDVKKFDTIKDMNVEIHPMFEMVNGNIEDWEKL